MSVASELSALNGYILGAYDEVDNKGGTVPQNKNMANLATAIASISGGGGGGANIATGEITYASKTKLTTSGYNTITHNLGREPLGIMWFLTDIGNNAQISAQAECVYAFYCDATQSIKMCNKQSSAFPYLWLEATTSHTLSNMFLAYGRDSIMFIIQQNWDTSYTYVPAGTTLKWVIW